MSGGAIVGGGLVVVVVVDLVGDLIGARDGDGVLFLAVGRFVGLLEEVCGA